jgi:hypothetical protein
MELASCYSSVTSDFEVAHGRSLKIGAYLHLSLYMYEAIIFPHAIHVTLIHVYISSVRV